MRACVTQLGAIGVLVGGSAAMAGGPAITEFEHNAGGWLATVSGETLQAFDQFRPGVAAATTCLAGTPGTSLYLAEGVVTVSKFDGQGVPGCAISDGSTPPSVSDGALAAGQTLVMDFSPPVSAFYTYYGSLAVGETVSMSLYSNGSPVAQLESDQSFHNSDAAGHGFVSDTLIDRIEFTATENGGVLVGAFVGLLAGEGSLGTVMIPGYAGPSGSTVQFDFGLVFAPDCNDNGVEDSVDIAQGDSLDVNVNDLPDECEFSGAVNGAVVWQSGRTVHLTGDLSVTGSLTVQPGVDVVPAEDVEIVVQAGGQLAINGTAAQPVRLRPVGVGRWDGVRFVGGGGSLRHAELERLNGVGVTVQDAAPTIDSCIIRNVGEPPSDCCMPHSGTGCSDAVCEALVCAANPLCCDDEDGVWDVICIVQAINLCGCNAPSGTSAYGVRVLGASNPVVSNTVIQGVSGDNGLASSSAGNGGNGSNGGNGAGGEACVGGGNNGSQGTPGGAGSVGQAGQNGGDAFGIFVGPGAAASVASCRITDLQGGNAGRGGNGGTGGSGGDGGNGGGGVFCGGNGANGRNGGAGGAAGDGGRGGHGYGVRLEQPAASVVEQNVVMHLVGGNGANGANGGNGGGGGDGGDGAFNTFSGGDGGNAGNGGNGGAAGDGGNGGSAQPISVLNHTTSLVFSQNTVGGNLTRGTNGVAGVRGSGGAEGSAGSGAAVGGSNGSGGSDGSLGAVGVNGVIGSAVGIHVSAGPSPVVTASNNIVIPGQPTYSVGMQAAGNAVIVGDFNCFFDFNLMISGGVAPGGSFVADPLFVDANGVDDLPGTEDDNRRLAAGSPCADTGGNAAIPPDAADLDGDANTAEPLPLDADGNPRIFAGTVDVGAYEFGSAAVPCPWDINGDGTINTVDFLSLLQQWGTNPGGPPDINGDGTVDTIDFLALLQHWGPCP